ncbi:YceD family protein [Kordiimonas marina]|uniref:YceD family protein n=1 Tax=Kordiimonas marina TaxID=2872312 RepID=UPI001FF13A2B|nr:YceD family protein [Kordiimonas marina]MCJ9430407.1 YceD family protein [Kordiimonas marina]
MTKTYTLAFKLPVEELDREHRHYVVEATEAERAQLVERFDIVALNSLSAEVDAWDGGDERFHLKGHLKADLVQRCITTLADVPEKIDSSFELMLVDAATADRMDAEEAYLDPAVPDYDAIEGNEIGLGEIVAQTLAISMNPYPRAEGAELEASSGGKVSVNEPELKRPNPFAVLEKLRDES